MKRLVVCWLVCFASANAHADMSEAELLATRGWHSPLAARLVRADNPRDKVLYKLRRRLAKIQLARSAVGTSTPNYYPELRLVRADPPHGL